MCPNCYDGSGRGFICDPCQVWSLEKFNLPLEFLKKSKRMAVAKEANIDDTEDTVIDSTIFDSQDVSLPLGQNHPTNSTAIDTNYRGASLLDDPSLVSDEESNKEENTILGDVSNNEKTAVFASTDVRKKEGSKVNVEVTPKDTPGMFHKLMIPIQGNSRMIPIKVNLRLTKV